MQKLKEQILANIGQISIWLGGVSLLTHIIMSFSSKLSFLHHFQIVYIRDYISIFSISGGRGSFSGFPFSPVSCLFFAMLIIGGIIYQKTDKKDSRLLRFGFFTTFLYKLVILLLLPFSYYQNKQIQMHTTTYLKAIPLTVYDFAITLLFSIVLLLFSVMVTKWLMVDQKIRLDETVKANGNLVYTSIKANLDKRFVHFIFDKVVAIYFATPLVMTLFASMMMLIIPNSINSFFGQKWFFGILFVASMFVYYLLTEGIFGSTPIKCLTGTRVVDMYKFENATFGHVVGRSLCRFIPFDSLSFFWKGDWHDDFSETLVVEEDNYGQNRKYHIWWVVAFISVYLIPYFYASFQNKKREMGNSFMSARHEEYRKRSRVFHIANGDFIEANRHENTRAFQHYLLRVINSDKLLLQTERYKLNREHSYLDKKKIIDINLSELELIDTLTINKDSLMTYFVKYRNRISINETEKVNIENVFSFNHPDIERGGGSYRDRDTAFFTSLGFYYDLMPINIINVEKISGNVEWEVDLPIPANYNPEQKRGSFELGLSSKKYLYDYKARLTIMYGDKLHKYILEGNRDNCIMYFEY